MVGIWYVETQKLRKKVIRIQGIAQKSPINNYINNITTNQ